jgi:tRNA U38,U39,U40 pseudouridine synthase TruA
MGTYYDVVCPAHKEVLRLGKTDMLSGELEYMVNTGELEKEATKEFSKKFIVLAPIAFLAVIEERPKAEEWLKKHNTCKLYYIDSEYSEEFNSYDGYAKFEAFELKSQKTFRQGIEIINPMSLLTEEEKLSIKLKVEAMPLSERHKQVRKEIFAAFRIIEKTLGHEWYEKALKKYVQETDIPQPSFFNGTNSIKEKYAGWGTNKTQYISKKNISNLDNFFLYNSFSSPIIRFFDR